MVTNKNNTKKIGKTNKLKCKCGSVRYEVFVYPDDEGEMTWIGVKCKKCNRGLFYNGA